MDLVVIANALATQIGTVTATTGGVSESATATSEMPDTVSKIALIVYPPAGELDIIMGPRLDDHYEFPVKLLRDPPAMATRSQMLLAWATALRLRVEGHITLGITGTEIEAWSTALRAQIDGERYGSIDGSFAVYDVVELTVRVHVRENAAVAS